MDINTEKMNRMLRNVGRVVLEEERKCLERLGRGLTPENCDLRKPDSYYRTVGDNLWNGAGNEEEKYPHLKRDYDVGSGGELQDGKSPAKMKSIRSSSAMTYNMLGNNSIHLTEAGDVFSSGEYLIAYEKKLLTLRRSLQPANLDAFLYNEQAEEAIFCEMKMLEWIEKPNPLSDSYLSGRLYFANNGSDTRAADAFLDAINRVKAAMGEYGNGSCFYRYDAWQMFKHMLGIYNMTSRVTREEIAELLDKKRNTTGGTDIELLPEMKKATLVNVIFEPPAELLSKEDRAVFEAFLKLEHTCFCKFKQAVHDSGIVDVFREDCGIAFDVQYLNTVDFMKYFDLGERRKYLERYRL